MTNLSSKIPPLGVRGLDFLVWDSNFFGYKIGFLEIFENDKKEEILAEIEQAKKENYKLLYLKSIKKLDFLPENAFLVDEKITFLQDIPSIETLGIKPNVIDIYESEIIDENLINLTLQSGEFSRFKIDKNFKNQEFERLYKIWIEKSVKKELAQKVIIQKINDKIVGLLTLNIRNNRANIDILAVDTDFRGQHIGKNLVEKSFLEASLLGQKEIQVITQKANENACAFYQKMGFSIEKIENIYHFWI